MRRPLAFISAWIVLSLIVAGGFLLSLWPHRPHSALGWALLIILALPLAALGEFLGERLIFHNDLAAALNSLGSGFVPSLVRILYVLLIYLVLAGVAGLVFA